MKTMSIFLVLFLMLFTLSAFASPIQGDLDTSFSAVLQFFLPAVLGSLSVLFADAKKWMGDGTWSWEIFWGTKISPFLLSLGVSVVIYFSVAYLPWTQQLFEALSGINMLEITAFTLIGMASALINGIFKQNRIDA